MDTVQGKDLLKLYPFIGLMPLLCRRVTARIPLPPPVAALPPAPSPRGKGRAFGAKNCPTNGNLFLQQLLLLVLQGIQLVISAPLLQKLLVSALLHDLSVA